MMPIRTGKQRFFATLFVCGILIWGVGSAFVELRDPGSGNDRWRIDHVTDAGTLGNEEAFQIVDIDGGTDPRLNLYLDNGRLGANQFCALDGTLCSTATEIADAVTGYTAGDGLSLGAATFSVNVDDASIEISGDTLQLKDLGVTTAKLNDLAVTTGKINNGAVTLAKLDADSVNSAKIVDDTILFDDLTGGLVLTSAEDDATTVGDLDGGDVDVIPTTDAVIGYVTNYVTANGDDLGDHTATTDLVLGTNAITGTTGNIDYTNFDVVGASGNTTIGGTLNVTGVTQLGEDGTDGSLVIYSDDAGGDFTYTINPGVATQNVVLTLPVDDGTANQLLQTDGNGVLTWADQAGADDLGDHTATQNLDLNTNDLVGTTAGINFDNFDVVGASGNTDIGGTLDVTGDFDVNSNFTIIAASGNTAIGGTLGVTGVTTLATDTSVTDGTFSVTDDSVATNTVVDVVSINASTSGTVENDFGVGLTFDAEDLGGVEEQGSIDLVMTDVTDTSEDSKIVLSVQEAGAIVEEFTVDGNGITLASGVSVNEISNDTTLGDSSATALITENAAKSYVDSQVGAINTNTLDEAYDEGGAGSGRSITVDSGAVQLIGSNAADETIEIGRDTTTTNAVIDVAVISASTSDIGNGANGLGAGLVFEVENDAGEIEERASIDVSISDVTDASEDSQLVFRVQEAGTVGSELTVSGGGITLETGATVNEIETTITDTDTAIPTSGAIFDYVAANGDDLGDHTATTNLDLATNDLVGTTAGINFDNFDVVGASGNTDIGGTLDVTGDFDVNSNFTITAASGNTAIGGTLGVTGALTAASIQLGGVGSTVTSILDEDAFGSDSDTALATQQSIKAYVDAQTGDNLGDHTATQDINMAGNWIGGDADGTEGVFVDADGEVGIGTNDPSAALEVNGQILASGTITSSDLRLKEDIKPLTNSLEKIRQVQTYSYLWKDKQRGEGVQFGVIAQEMEEVYPDVVHTFEDGYKAVNYQALVAPLIDAVQELSDRVEALEAENQALKNATSSQ